MDMGNYGYDYYEIPDIACVLLSSFTSDYLGYFEFIVNLSTFNQARNSSLKWIHESSKRFYMKERPIQGQFPLYCLFY